MAENYCVLCHKKHDDYAWRLQTWWDAELNENVEGWACTKHHYPSKNVSLTDKRLEPERKKHAKDLIQPYRSGEPSKEFADAYPKQAKKLFKGEKKKPRKVWK